MQVHKLWVGNVPFNATEAQFKAAFDEYGMMESGELVWDNKKRAYKGFGYIVFVDEESADAAIADEVELDGRVLLVKRSVQFDSNSRACFAFQAGKCTKGSACKFEHAETARTVSEREDEAKKTKKSAPGAAAGGEKPAKKAKKEPASADKTVMIDGQVLTLKKVSKKSKADKEASKEAGKKEKKGKGKK